MKNSSYYTALQEQRLHDREVLKVNAIDEYHRIDVTKMSLDELKGAYQKYDTLYGDIDIEENPRFKVADEYVCRMSKQIIQDITNLSIVRAINFDCLPMSNEELKDEFEYALANFRQNTSK